MSEFDESLRNSRSGIDQRSLVQKEVQKHLRDFALTDQFSSAKIEQLSGGQR